MKTKSFILSIFLKQGIILVFFIFLLQVTNAQTTEIGTDNDYILGEQWNRIKINKNHIKKSKYLRRITSGIGYFLEGTSFYLGIHQGKHILATNYHICPNQEECLNKKVYFPSQRKKAIVKEFIGSWPEIELSLLIIDPKGFDLKKLKRSAYPLSFQTIKKGLPLFTLGYGKAFNKKQRLAFDSSRWCKVFSKTNQFILFQDPDEFNPAPYRTWSYATGCEVSHGDSGSPVFVRRTTKLIGIIWTMRAPKSKFFKKEDNIKAVFRSENHPEIWKQLSYVVPTIKMRDFLKRAIISGEINTPWKIKIIKSIFKNKRIY